MAESAICILKNLWFLNYIHSLIVELSPYISTVIFDVREIVALVSATLVNTNCMQVVSIFILLHVLVNILDALLDRRNFGQSILTLF